MTHENELWPQDEELFATIEKSVISESERQFFNNMYTKMLDENTPWPETLVWEHDNTDNLYLLRLGYDEFMIGKGTTREEWQDNEIHTMNLSDVLFVNLKQAKLLDRDITFLQWLRENNFSCVKYNHENDGNDN
ncbi:MAG: hypothetical protein K2G85_00920 [Muribaculaceae bacterium]|nr:hypothetical protein [Muribaculaceae bacterium]